MRIYKSRFTVVTVCSLKKASHSKITNRAYNPNMSQQFLPCGYGPNRELLVTGGNSDHHGSGESIIWEVRRTANFDRTYVSVRNRAAMRFSSLACCLVGPATMAETLTQYATRAKACIQDGVCTVKVVDRWIIPLLMSHLNFPTRVFGGIMKSRLDTMERPAGIGLPFRTTNSLTSISTRKRKMRFSPNIFLLIYTRLLKQGRLASNHRWE